jgi:hypothetical protein
MRLANPAIKKNLLLVYNIKQNIHNKRKKKEFNPFNLFKI